MIQLTLQEYIDKALDSAYEKTAGRMLLQIDQLSTSPSSQMQKSLDELQQEALRLEQDEKPITQDTPALKNALNAYGVVLSATAALIQANDNAIQATGQVIAVPSVTSKVFSGLTSSLLQQGIDPMSPASQKAYKNAIAKTGAKWINPKEGVDFASDFVETAEWAAKMEGWGSGYHQMTKNILLQGMQNGWSPKFTADVLTQHASNIPYSAAENLTRTLQVTSYREASLAVETMNNGFLVGKIRIAHLDPRTCLSCIALHGTKMEIGERVDDHYRGRCSEFYQVPGGPEFPEFMQADSTPGNRRFVPFQTGEEWFASLPYERQQRQASFASTPAKLVAYRSGNPLSSFIGDHTDPVFGHQFIENSLVGAFGDDAKNYYSAKKPATAKLSNKSALGLGDFENSISGNDFETAGAYSQDGTLLFVKTGDKSRIKFTIDELNQLSGSTLTHNHPNGTSFSREDIKLFMNEKVAEIRAVGNEFVYSMMNPSSVKMTNKAIDRQYQAALRQALINNPDASDKDILSDAWSIFAEKNGLTYERIPR